MQKTSLFNTGLTCFVFISLGFVDDDLVFDNKINMSVQSLHGFLANQKIDGHIFSLDLCCRTDGNPDDPALWPLQMPFILLKVNQLSFWQAMLSMTNSPEKYFKKYWLSFMFCGYVLQYFGDTPGMWEPVVCNVSLDDGQGQECQL